MQEHFATLTLGATDSAAFATQASDLPGLAQSRDLWVQSLDVARQARDNSAATLRNAGIRVPKIIEGRAARSLLSAGGP